MRTSQKCIDLIRRFEGFSSVPYLCPANVPTIGYGSTIYENGSHVTMQDPPIDEKRATAIMYARLVEFENAVNRYVQVTLGQNQFDAIVDFTYNLGAKALLNSTLLKKINTKDWVGAAPEFLRWIYADGKKLKGLVTRRLAEQNLFEQPMGM